MISKLLFGKKKKISKTQGRLQVLYPNINWSERKYMFLVCNLTQLSGIGNFTEKKDLKELVKFAFYIKNKSL